MLPAKQDVDWIHMYPVASTPVEIADRPQPQRHPAAPRPYGRAAGLDAPRKSSLKRYDLRSTDLLGLVCRREQPPRGGRQPPKRRRHEGLTTTSGGKTVRLGLIALAVVSLATVCRGTTARSAARRAAGVTVSR